MKNTFRLLLLALLSGLLLIASWPVSGFSPLIFLAFVPLLSIEEKLFQTRGSYNNLKLFAYAYLSFFIWNILKHTLASAEFPNRKSKNPFIIQDAFVSPGCTLDVIKTP